MIRSRRFFVIFPLAVFVLTQALYSIYAPHISVLIAHLRAPIEPAGQYYSPFLTNDSKFNDENFAFFWVCVLMNAMFSSLWVSVGSIKIFESWSEKIKKDRVRRGDDKILAQMFLGIVICLGFLIAIMPGRVNSIREELLVGNLYVYVCVYSVVVYLIAGIVAFVVVYVLALRALRRERLDAVRSGRGAKDTL